MFTFRSILNNAIGADKIVQQKYGTHKAGIDVLSKSQVGLQFMVHTGQTNPGQGNI